MPEPAPRYPVGTRVRLAPGIDGPSSRTGTIIGDTRAQGGYLVRHDGDEVMSFGPPLGILVVKATWAWCDDQLELDGEVC